MPIPTPWQISESALVNFYNRFSHSSKGFNVQFAATCAAYTPYSILKPVVINYDRSVSQQLFEGAWDLETLLLRVPGIMFPAFQYFCPISRNTGEEKNHTFGGRIPMVLMVHLSYPDVPPMHLFNGRVSLLANAIEDTIYAMYATPATLGVGSNNYQLWPQPQFVPNSLIATRTDIVKGARGFAQGIKFDMLWDLQTAS